MADNNESQFGIDATQAFAELQKLTSGFQAYNASLNSVIDTSINFNQAGAATDKLLVDMSKQAQGAATAFANLAKNQKLASGQIIGTQTVVNPSPINANAVQNVNQVNNALQQANTSAKTFNLSLQSIARLAISRIIVRSIFDIIAGLKDAVHEASNFELQLGKLQAIHPGNLDQFTTSLQALAGQFGQGLSSEAANLFTILTEQIGTTSQALDVLTTANELARASQISLSVAVDLTTTVIKEFGLSSSQSNQVAAELVRTMQLGKVSAEELAQGIGKVGQAAEALGVSRQEVEAFVATLSEAGVKPGEAFSLLNNILLKLAHPTAALQKEFSELGIASIQLEIQSKGLQAVLQELTAQSGTSAEGIGDLFDRVRTARGVLAVTGDSAEQYAKNLKDIQSVQEELLHSTDQLIAQTPAARLQKDVAEAQASLINGFGRDVLRSTADVIDAFGGVDSILKDTGAIAEGLAISTGILAVGFTSASIAGVQFTGVLGGISAVAAANPFILLATGLGLGIAAIIRLTSESGSAADALNRLNKETEAHATLAKADAKVLTQLQTEALKNYTRDLNTSFDIIKKLYDQDRDAAQVAQDQGGRSLKKALSDRVNVLNDYARNLEQVQARASQDVKKLLIDNAQLQNQAGEARFERSIVGLSDPDKAAAEATRALQLIRTAQDAAAKGNVDIANELGQQATELANSSASLSHNETIANQVLQARIGINNTLIDQRKKEAEAAGQASAQTKAIADKVADDVAELSKLDLLSKGKDVTGAQLADLEQKRRALTQDIDAQIAKLPPIQIPLFLDSLSLNKQLAEIKRGVEQGGRFVTVQAAVEFEDQNILNILTQHTSKIPLTIVATFETISGQKFDPFAGPAVPAQKAAQNLADIQKQVNAQADIPGLQENIGKANNAITVAIDTLVTNLKNESAKASQITFEAAPIEGFLDILQALGVVSETLTSATPQQTDKFKTDYLNLIALKQQILSAITSGSSTDFAAAQAAIKQFATNNPGQQDVINQLENALTSGVKDQAQLNVDLQVQADTTPALQQIGAIQAQVPTITVPVQVQQNHAKGGPVVGPDIQNIGRTPGEFIVNPLASQMFRPQLVEMNRFSQGGVVQNFGDINVTATAHGGATIDAEDIAVRIQRKIRMKTIRSF